MLNHHILLIDDDEEERYLLHEAFKAVGYNGHLKFLTSGEAALKYLQLLSPPFFPSLIVLDFNMPGLNGAEILAQIKRMEGSTAIPIVFYSSGMRPLVKELLMACGATACLQKPGTQKEVDKIVQILLELAKAEKQHGSVLWEQ